MMDMKKPDSTFRDLHKDGLLVLANVTDAGSARIVESLGCKAVATSSAAVAWSHGYPDGNTLPLELLSNTVRSMARVLTVPLTVDIEGGYSHDLNNVSHVINSVIKAGAVGINLEDGSESPDLLCQKIEVARSVANQLGVDLFINARTDIYLKALVPVGERLEETVRRASLYSEAGADGVFAAGMVEANDIEALCQSTRLPVNVLFRENLPDQGELERLGVKRLSAGSSIAELLYGANAAIAKNFLQTGCLTTQSLNAYTYQELNSMMAGASTT
ncbi:isocitrate lyase/phosphoenolpyruvate mutase family protein [Halomonas sp. DP3Y7-2]|nr:isocitrate lyase/phosphoenolpyruvate mutase family protein [Halomonas sp. DP3Y7-2]MBY6228752.1 isocitrate lyase/phosphoenolpyruvate mutase family protein [Halomonas sp. DP3Y7-1]